MIFFLNTLNRGFQTLVILGGSGCQHSEDLPELKGIPGFRGLCSDHVSRGYFLDTLQKPLSTQRQTAGKCVSGFAAMCLTT